MRRLTLVLFIATLAVLTATSEARADWPVVESQTRAFGVIVDDGSAGEVAWSEPANAMASDDKRAQVVLVVGGMSHWLKGTGAGFAVPLDSIIKGIEVRAEARALAGSGTADLVVFLSKANVTQMVGQVCAVPSETDAVIVYGDPADLWQVAWTPADINHSGFGAEVFAFTHPAQTLAVDSLTLTVYYLPPAPYALRLPLVAR